MLAIDDDEDEAPADGFDEDGGVDGLAADGGFADDGGLDGRLLGSLLGEDGDDEDALADRIVNVFSFVSTRTSCPIATCLAAVDVDGCVAGVDGCEVDGGCADGVDDGCCDDGGCCEDGC